MGTLDRTTPPSPPPPTIPPPRQPQETSGRLLKARQRNPGKAVSHTQQL